MSTTSTQTSAHVVELHTGLDADRIRDALCNARQRRMTALLDSLERAKQQHARDWVSFEWDAKELIRG